MTTTIDLDGQGGADNSIVGNGGNDVLSVDVGLDGDFGSGVMFGGDGNDVMENYHPRRRRHRDARRGG